MNATANNLRDAWSAFGAFLRGFVGVVRDGDASPTCRHRHDDHRDARADEPTPASVRAALTARAARRPNCC